MQMNLTDGMYTLQRVQTQSRPNPEPIRKFTEPISVFLRIWLKQSFFLQIPEPKFGNWKKLFHIMFEYKFHI